MVSVAALPPAAVRAEYVEVVKLLAPPDMEANDRFGEFVGVFGDRLAVASPDWSGSRGSVYVYGRNAGGSNAWGPIAKLVDRTPESGELFGRTVGIDATSVSVVSNDGISLFAATARLTWEPGATIALPHYGPHAYRGDTIVWGDVLGLWLAVFGRDGGGPNRWGLVAALRPSDGEPGRFAESVALDGDVIVAGAYSDDALANDAGSAYVWERDADGNWQELEVAKLYASDGAAEDEFGRSVAVEGDLIAVGAPFADAPLPNTGAVYLYRQDSTGRWLEIAKLVADDAAVGDVAGRNETSLAITEGRVFVGAYNRDVGDLDRVGAAFVFEEDEAGVWRHTATLRAHDEELNDEFGTSVAASGDTIVIGAEGDSEVGHAKGAAYVFQRVAAPAIDVAGACPGTVTLSVSGATPGGGVVIAGSGDQGLTDPPGNVCPEIELALAEPSILRRLVVDADGRAQFAGPVGAEFCGWFLQAVDAVTCGVGGITQLP